MNEFVMASHINKKLRARVSLVSMPFASCRCPSLALSILKPILNKDGHAASISYYNLLYAKMIGEELYEFLTGDQSYNIGEQAFAHLIFPQRDGDDAFRKFIEEAVPYDQFRKLVDRARDLIEFAATELILSESHVIGMTTTFYQKMAAIALTLKLREKGSKALIVFGGAACESPMGEALLSSFEGVDAVFHGDAEESFPTFIRYVLEGLSSDLLFGVSVRNLEGVVATYASRKSTSATLATPLPDYSDFISALKRYGLGNISWFLSYESSRGCWWGEKHHCTFCGLNGTQMSFRKKSIFEIVTDLREIKNIYGGTFIQFTDNILHFSFIKELLPHLASIEGQQYFFEVKSNLKEEDFLEFYRAGVTEIQPGIERLNDEALKIMRKGTSALQNVHAIRLAAEYGIRVSWNIIFGFPGETVKSVKKELLLLKRLQHLQPPGVCAEIRLDRFSPNFDYAVENGILLLGPSVSEAYIFYGLEEKNNLSYHFSFDYIDTPSDSLLRGWKQLEVSANNWRNVYKPGQLMQFREGKNIVIRDLRDVGDEKEIVLEGVAAEVYTFIVVPRSIDFVQKYFPDARKIIDVFMKKNIVIICSGRVLALAVRDKAMLGGFDDLKDIIKLPVLLV
jgi:ribosomal peptide maturation radical SAM protein 1